MASDVNCSDMRRTVPEMPDRDLMKTNMMSGDLFAVTRSLLASLVLEDFIKRIDVNISSP